MASWTTGLAALAVASTAFAWSQNSEFGARVHNHEFKRVMVDSSDCTIQYKLYFGAPADQYASAAKPRNVYLFRSRIDFLDGKSITIPVFANRAPGERMYENAFDTTAQGCWAKTPQKVVAVKVEGCRGDGCAPQQIQ
jgi:hypothetical protein